MQDDTDDQQPKKQAPLTKRQKNKAIEGFKIYTTPATQADLVFIAREFVLCTLPHSDPGDVPLWKRTNGNLTLGIQPGMNIETGKSYGIPYGTIPRLLLIWMITEILRTKSRRLELGNHLSDFMKALGLNSSNGSTGAKRSDARRLRKQMERLFHATISFMYSQKGAARTGSAWLDMQIAPEGILWWSDKEPDNGVLWGSWIEVSEKFYQAVMANPHPLDIRVLRHIKDSALGIDLYTILNREAYRAMKDGKPRFLAWEWLYMQTGNEYTTETAVHDFRRKALVQIDEITKIHSGLLVKIQKGRRGQKSGLVISNLSTPSIIPEQPRQSLPQGAGEAQQQPPSLAIVPPSEKAFRHLKPATVEQFRALYPLLDPNACQYAFDAWQGRLAPEDRAKHYDKAFLGFASKWVKGKT
jgi:hypothetical protein